MVCSFCILLCEYSYKIWVANQAGYINKVENGKVYTVEGNSADDSCRKKEYSLIVSSYLDMVHHNINNFLVIESV